VPYGEPRRASDQSNRFQTVTALADETKVRLALQDRPQTLANDGVVICQHD